MPLSTDALEAKFATKAGIANTKVLDMNVSTAAVVGELNAMLAMRSELMSQYGTPKDPKYKPNSIKAPGAPAAALASMAKPKPPTPSAGASTEGGSDDFNYKNVLMKALREKHEGVLLREKLTYTVTGSNKEWTCTLSGPDVLAAEYTPDSPAPSKKWAEAAAAALAVQTEFPELYKGPPAMAPKEPRAPKSAGERVESECPKNRMNKFVQAILGRSCVKDQDIVYTVSEEGEEENMKYTCVLTFPTQDASPQFSSAVFDSRRDAEMEAASLSLVWLEPLAVQALEERRKNKGSNENEQPKSKKSKTGGGSGSWGEPNWNQMMAMMTQMMKGKGKGKGKGWW